MTTKRKSRNGANRAASNTTHLNNSNASRIKALIVNLALWGVTPFGLSMWLIRRLHLEAS